jgi:hypothetical protein
MKTHKFRKSLKGGLWNYNAKNKLKNLILLIIVFQLPFGDTQKVILQEIINKIKSRTKFFNTSSQDDGLDKLFEQFLKTMEKQLYAIKQVLYIFRKFMSTFYYSGCYSIINKQNNITYNTYKRNERFLLKLQYFIDGVILVKNDLPYDSSLDTSPVNSLQGGTSEQLDSDSFGVSGINHDEESESDNPPIVDKTGADNCPLNGLKAHTSGLSVAHRFGNDMILRYGYIWRLISNIDFAELVEKMITWGSEFVKKEEKIEKIEGTERKKKIIEVIESGSRYNSDPDKCLSITSSKKFQEILDDFNFDEIGLNTKLLGRNCSGKSKKCITSDKSLKSEEIFYFDSCELAECIEKTGIRYDYINKLMNDIMNDIMKVDIYKLPHDTAMDNNKLAVNLIGLLKNIEEDKKKLLLLLGLRIFSLEGIDVKLGHKAVVQQICFRLDNIKHYQRPELIRNKDNRSEEMRREVHDMFATMSNNKKEWSEEEGNERNTGNINPSAFDFAETLDTQKDIENFGKSNKGGKKSKRKRTKKSKRKRTKKSKRKNK